MRILVTVKRVIDPYARIRVRADHTGVETAHVKMAINPFDEIALEEAVRLKEKGDAKEVIVLSVGSCASQETLRGALALGADRATLIETDEDLQPLSVAKLIQAFLLIESCDVVLMGKQSIDGDHNQTGQLLAALLKWPQATFASKITPQGEYLEVVREVDEGLETLCVKRPAVITVDLRLNEPRYPTLPNIMKAKQKSLAVLKASEMNVDLQPQIKILRVDAPPVRKAGEKVNSAAELVQKLRNEAKVI